MYVRAEHYPSHGFIVLEGRTQTDKRSKKGVPGYGTQGCAGWVEASCIHAVFEADMHSCTYASMLVFISQRKWDACLFVASHMQARRSEPREAARIAYKYNVSGSKLADGRLALVCCLFAVLRAVGFGVAFLACEIYIFDFY